MPLESTREIRIEAPRPPGRFRAALLVFLILCLYAVLLVGWEVVQSSLYPGMHTGMRHFLLTVRAGVVTAIACLLVYGAMRRQQRRLAATADGLAQLLESFETRAPGAAHARFDNPNLVHCREVVSCGNHGCPMFDRPGERCWQMVALARACGRNGGPDVDIHQCHECRVWKASCPDELTRLGESFNSLMFLLEEETERARRMRVQMVEKQKMAAVGRLAAGIAHEVVNPLASISSVVQLLKRNRTERLPREQLESIEGDIERISTIMRQVKGLACRVTEVLEPVDVGAILEESVRLASFDHRARRVEIDFEPPVSLPQTVGIRHELQQVFVGLAMNALDAMPEGGTLRIRATRERGDIVISFLDTGCGIEAEIGRRIFEPFFTTKEPGSGAGLGLAVSYGIVRKHGGTIDFTSVPGKGSRFVVRIPIADRSRDPSHE